MNAMTMLIRRLRNLPILYLLIISLLINPAVASGYALGVAADSHSLRNETIAGDYAADYDVENAAYRWGNSHPRQSYQLGSLLANSPLPTGLAQVPLLECNLNTPRLINPSPRIPDQILHHRTIVLLI